jgi:hypothetical protein
MGERMAFYVSAGCELSATQEWGLEDAKKFVALKCVNVVGDKLRAPQRDKILKNLRSCFRKPDLVVRFGVRF